MAALDGGCRLGPTSMAAIYGVNYMYHSTNVYLAELVLPKNRSADVGANNGTAAAVEPSIADFGTGY